MQQLRPEHDVLAAKCAAIRWGACVWVSVGWLRPCTSELAHCAALPSAHCLPWSALRPGPMYVADAGGWGCPPPTYAHHAVLLFGPTYPQHMHIMPYCYPTHKWDAEPRHCLPRCVPCQAKIRLALAAFMRYCIKLRFAFVARGWQPGWPADGRPSGSGGPPRRPAMAVNLTLHYRNPPCLADLSQCVLKQCDRWAVKWWVNGRGKKRRL